MLSTFDWGQFATPPHDLQKGYIEDCINPQYQYVASFCGLQSGKTYGECDGGYAALYGQNPIMLPEKIRGRIPMEVWLISRNYTQAEVLFDTFKSRTPPEIWLSDQDLRKWGLRRGDRFTHWLAPRHKCGDPLPIKLLVRTASDPESLRATNKLGLAICDELAHWKPMAWSNLQARGIVVKTKFLVATSPKAKNFAYRNLAQPGGYTQGAKGRHPIKDPKIAVHTWTSEDNPEADKEHIERLRRLFGREYARQELDGMFTEQVGYVYGTFDRSMMGPPPSQNPKDYEKITAGIDFGWTDPYAACVWGLSKGDGRWYQLFELHATQSTDEDVAPDLLRAQEKWQVPKWYCDKRFPSNIHRLKRLGLRAYANLDIHAENDKRTIPVMLAVVQGLMQQDKIRILRSHEWTAEEFEKYHYPDPSEDNPKNTNDNPVDWSNHHMDAMRYALCSVIELSHSGNRYRQGADQKPKEVKSVIKKSAIPTFAESLAHQDEKFDRMEDARMGGKRQGVERFFRNRMKRRRDLL